MNDKTAIWAETAVTAFFKCAEAQRGELMCAESALEAHKKDTNLEGSEETQVWHLILTLANHSDERGFFRDQVFGPKRVGGPRVHQVVCGVRALCISRGYDFDELYRQVNEHMAIDGPVMPSI